MNDRERLQRAFERNKREYSKRTLESNSKFNEVSRSVKSWYAAAAGLTGVLLAILTAYSSIRAIDDLRAVISEWPIAWNDPSHHPIEGTLTATFINAGNRPIAIAYVNLYLLKDIGQGKDGGTCKIDAKDIALPTKFESVVIKAGELQRVVVSLDERLLKPKEKELKQFVGTNFNHLAVCFMIASLTPDSSVGVKQLFRRYVSFFELAGPEGGDPKTPWPIVHQNKSLLSLTRDWLHSL